MFYFPLPRCSVLLHPTQASYSTRVLLSPSGTTTITLALNGERGPTEVRTENMKGQGRAQRTKLAPLSKTCKVLAVKQCLRSFYLVMWPLQSWTDLIRTENNLRSKGMFSIEYLRVKGKSELETFLCSSHGLAFQPDDFKLARGAHG